MFYCKWLCLRINKNKMAEYLYKGHNLAVTDFETLNKIKSEIENDFLPNVLYISPRDRENRIHFEIEIIKADRSLSKLRDNSFLLEMLKYQTTPLELYLWTPDTTQMSKYLIRESLIISLKNRKNNGEQ